MYNIKQAAARAGVSVPVLRAWERRYGIVAPERSPSGYRQFDDEAVARIRAMRALIEEGWSPSAAAAAIVEGRVAVPDGTERDTGGPTNPSEGTAGIRTAASGVRTTDREEPGRTEAEAADLGRALIEAAAAMDAAGVDRALDDLFARGSFERVATDLLFPALQRLGEAWAAGEISVAGEHLASNAVLRRLGVALDAAGAGGAGKSIVVGLPPGGRHELGALAFAVAARRAGLPVRYVGADLPLSDWVTATRGAAGAVIGVVTARDRRSAMDVARELRAADPGLLVAFGGRAAPESEDVLHLGGSLRASVATLREKLASAQA
ncbi:MAG TPA: MerR family transcriptional regulator [Candidatus Limnocylindrales bacterium]|nr:MerR family transcriptional regulator [Candidatus Limnocylindrales bacterium]